MNQTTPTTSTPIAILETSATSTPTIGACSFWKAAAERFSGELTDWRRLAQYLLARELKHQSRYEAMEQTYRRLVEEKGALRKQLDSSQDSLKRLMGMKRGV